MRRVFLPFTNRLPGWTVSYQEVRCPQDLCGSKTLLQSSEARNCRFSMKYCPSYPRLKSSLQGIFWLGFWHCFLDEESSLLTTFKTPYGRYRWLRLSFGLSVSSDQLEIFQICVSQVLEGLEGVLNIANDILICGAGDSNPNPKSR